MTWEDAIESYKTYLILEKSLSSNSVEAYLNDIKKLAKYCADKHHVTTPDAISYDHLKDYLMFINEVGVTNRTQARCISSIRSFYSIRRTAGKQSDQITRSSENRTEITEHPDNRRNRRHVEFCRDVQTGSPA